MAFILKAVSLALNSPDTLFSHQALVTITGVLKIKERNDHGLHYYSNGVC